MQQFISVSREHITRSIVFILTHLWPQERADFVPSNPADAQWRVGPGYIELKDIYLVEIRHVAKSSWQPIFEVAQQPGDLAPWWATSFVQYPPFGM